MLYHPLVLDENVQVRDKLFWAGLRQSAKDRFMRMGLAQMEARILRVKLHQKLTPIISLALNKEA